MRIHGFATLNGQSHSCDVNRIGWMMAKAQKAQKLNPLARMSRYFGDVRSEMKRVVWPNRNEVLNSSMVVIFTLFVFITFIFAVDSAVLRIVSWVAGIGG